MAYDKAAMNELEDQFHQLRKAYSREQMLREEIEACSASASFEEGWYQMFRIAFPCYMSFLEV
jgi:hypothetical protein